MESTLSRPRNDHCVVIEGLDSTSSHEVAKGPSGRFYSGTSFCCRPSHAPRRWAIQLVESRPFDPFILIVIICNCITMAWESPLDPCCTPKAAFIDVCEQLYLAIFTLEMLVKIVAYGFLVNEHAYLKDAWCQLDITVVTLAWLPSPRSSCQVEP